MESPAPHIRPATPADEAFIRAVMPRLVEFGPPAWRDPAQLTATDVAVLLESVRAPTPQRQVLVAERHGRPLGLLHLTVLTDFYQQQHGHVADLAVAAEAEGQGIGRALLSYAESWARALGFPWLTLSVFAQNERARAVYERAGFEQDIVKYLKVL
ncbi:GNAT family N-acetyltransferase [Hymenobacter sp. 15J16-1T3B]|uniref:GNAT family N-acetyltransferase n=1 Tax=Hymenobacter sp. 15J16-1T3B TaxID=2886941 RepID=UPI001D11ABD3|nr:GNAT family N-acetyltransferase [Hymenobacter sp. 15J16-1T3B]MCC3160833.1 GNAT family N-acetyltransferase [Hymenobacter sp. 15J16-1T3B]